MLQIQKQLKKHQLEKKEVLDPMYHKEERSNGFQMLLTNKFMEMTPSHLLTAGFHIPPMLKRPSHQLPPLFNFLMMKIQTPKMKK
jgi:hypothetical protein